MLRCGRNFLGCTVSYKSKDLYVLVQTRPSRVTKNFPFLFVRKGFKETIRAFSTGDGSRQNLDPTTGLEPVKDGFAIRRLDHFGIGRVKNFMPILFTPRASPTISAGAGANLHPGLWVVRRTVLFSNLVRKERFELSRLPAWV